MSTAESSPSTNPQATKSQSELWKATAVDEGNDFTWDRIYCEKNTFLEIDSEGQGKISRRSRSDSSLSTSNGSRRGSFTPGLGSAASGSAPHSSQPRWYHGCYMKYRLSACNEPNCTHLHDLDGNETACFIAWTERENHIVFHSEDSSLGPEAGDRERSKDRGDHSSSSNTAEEGQLDSSGRRDSQQKTRGYHDSLQQLRENFKDCDDAALASNLPRDSLGQSTSIGSTLHTSGRCKPCQYKISSQPCADGLRCLYCHMDHGLRTSVGSGSAAQQPTAEGKSKVRPCKGKRDRYRKHVSRISEQIMADPFSWSAETMAIPPSIECNPELKRKFLARMAVIAEHARTRAPRAAASSSGAMGTTMLPPISSGEVISSNVVSATAAAGDGQHCSEATELIKRGTLVSL